jgi:hypothetical protein
MKYADADPALTLSRRTFLAGLAAPLLQYAPANPIRIGLLADDDASAALRGVRFGAEEAGRTASLLSRRFELVGAAGQSDLLAVIALKPTRSASRATVIVARSTACSSAFRILPGNDPDITAWHPSLERFGAGQLNDRYKSKYGFGMSEDDWAGWFAVKMVAEAILRSNATSDRDVESYLMSARGTFDGHKGVALRFDQSRGLLQPWYDRQGRTVRAELMPCT